MTRAGALGLSLRDVSEGRDADTMTHPAALVSIPIGVPSNASALLEVLVPGRATDVASCDWDALFTAVKERLRGVSDGPASVATQPDAAKLQHVQRVVAECIAALDQLHDTMANELGRRQLLELDVSDANTALAQTRAELVGTQTGERGGRHLALHDSLTSLPKCAHFL